MSSVVMYSVAPCTSPIVVTLLPRKLVLQSDLKSFFGFGKKQFFISSQFPNFSEDWISPKQIFIIFMQQLEHFVETFATNIESVQQM